MIPFKDKTLHHIVHADGYSELSTQKNMQTFIQVYLSFISQEKCLQTSVLIIIFQDEDGNHSGPSNILYMERMKILKKKRSHKFHHAYEQNVFEHQYNLMKSNFI